MCVIRDRDAERWAEINRLRKQALDGSGAAVRSHLIHYRLLRCASSLWSSLSCGVPSSETTSCWRVVLSAASVWFCVCTGADAVGHVSRRSAERAARVGDRHRKCVPCPAFRLSALSLQLLCAWSACSVCLLICVCRADAKLFLQKAREARDRAGGEGSVLLWLCEENGRLVVLVPEPLQKSKGCGLIDRCRFLRADASSWRSMLTQVRCVCDLQERGGRS